MSGTLGKVTKISRAQGVGKGEEKAELEGGGG